MRQLLIPAIFSTISSWVAITLLSVGVAQAEPIVQVPLSEFKQMIVRVGKLKQREKLQAELIGHRQEKDKVQTELTGANGGPVQITEVRRTIVDPSAGKK